MKNINQEDKDLENAGLLDTPAADDKLVESQARGHDLQAFKIAELLANEPQQEVSHGTGFGDLFIH